MICGRACGWDGKSKQFVEFQELSTHMITKWIFKHFGLVFFFIAAFNLESDMENNNKFLQSLFSLLATNTGNRNLNTGDKISECVFVAVLCDPEWYLPKQHSCQTYTEAEMPRTIHVYTIHTIDLNICRAIVSESISGNECIFWVEKIEKISICVSIGECKEE